MAEGEWEVVSFAPVEHGVAVLGLADKLNSTGAIAGKQWNPDGSLSLQLRDGGTLLAWSEKRPARLQVHVVSGTDGQMDGADRRAGPEPVPFEYAAGEGRLEISLPRGGALTVRLWW